MTAQTVRHQADTVLTKAVLVGEAVLCCVQAWQPAASISADQVECEG